MISYNRDSTVRLWHTSGPHCAVFKISGTKDHREKALVLFMLKTANMKEGVYMANMNELINKLQLALKQVGVETEIKRRSFYSQKYKKFVTAWKVKERTDEGNKLLVKAYSSVAVVKVLAARYEEAKKENGTG